MHTSKSIPNFQFKIRFNPFYNSWEVWTYLAGETNPAKARWMICTKDTAIWYETTKHASIVEFEHIIEDKLGNDVLVDDVVQAVTRKSFDSKEATRRRKALIALIFEFQGNRELEKDPEIMRRIVYEMQLIKDLEKADKAFNTSTDLANNVPGIAHS